MSRPPGRPRTTPQPRPTGSIRADEILPLAVVRQRLGWGNKTAARAIRDGLPAVEYGRQKFCLGRHVLEWFAELAQEQEAGEAPGVKRD
jgi:hypothetical protein